MKALIETDEQRFLLDVLIHAALRAAQEGSGGEFGGSKHSSPAGWVVTGDAAAAKQGLDMHRLQAVPWTRLLVPQKLSCCCLMGEKNISGFGWWSNGWANWNLTASPGGLGLGAGSTTGCCRACCAHAAAGTSPGLRGVPGERRARRLIAHLSQSGVTRCLIILPSSPLNAGLIAACCGGEQTRGQAQLWGSDAGSRALLAPVQRRAEDWQTHPLGSCLSGAVSCSIPGLGRHRERGRKSSRLLAPPQGKSKSEGEGQAGCGAVGNESCVRDFSLGISSPSPHCSVTWLSPAASRALLAWERFRAVAAMP